MLLDPNTWKPHKLTSQMHVYPSCHACGHKFNKGDDVIKQCCIKYICINCSDILTRYMKQRSVEIPSAFNKRTGVFNTILQQCGIRRKLPG